MAIKKIIKFNKLAQFTHARFMISCDKQAELIFKILTRKMIQEITKSLKQDKLAKSDDSDLTLKRGWSGDIPKIEIDVSERIESVMAKYMKAMDWALHGDYAGKEARDAAKKVGIVGKVIPGIIPSVYLHSLDSNNKHFKDITGMNPTPVNSALMKETMETVIERSQKMMEDSMARLQKIMENTLLQQIEMRNFKNANIAMKEAHNLLPIDGQPTEESIGDAVEETLRASSLTKALDDSVDGFLNTWRRDTKTGIAMASSVATHQSILEVYGRSDDDVRVVNIDMNDEKTCTFCKKISRRSDGQWIYYRMSQLMPAGYNFYRKKEDWKVSIAPQHFNCYCQTVYAPRGFKVSPEGDLIQS